MIEIKAATRREFKFPAPVPLALDFFSSFRRITQFLPHISLVREFEDGRYRLLYSTVELATYEVHIFADVATLVDESDQTITVSPALDFLPVNSKAGLRSLTAPGHYSSRSIFHNAGDNQCEIEYILELNASLPRPLGLSLVPGTVLNSIALSITHRRMEEIIDGFITRSKNAYSQWYDNLEIKE
jgi:hypothetical protein